MALLTEDEAAVYDRQLRVWGVETQRKLSSARVLVINVTGVAAEMCKNICLAGVGSLSLLDGTPAARAAPGNFLVPSDAPHDMSVAQASAATLSEMNPLVRVEAVAPPEGAASAAVLPPAFLAGFRAVVLAGATPSEAAAACDACRSASAASSPPVAFFAVSVRGAHGHFFVDLGVHTYVPVVPKKADDDAPAAPPAPVTLHYCTLQEALASPLSALPARTNPGYVLLRLTADGADGADASSLRAAAAKAAAAGLSPKAAPSDEHLSAYAAGATVESPPIAAVVGGVLANDVLKAVSGSGAPAHNFFFFDTLTNAGAMQAVGCSAPKA